MTYTAMRVFLRAIGPLSFLLVSCTGNIDGASSGEGPVSGDPAATGNPDHKPSANDRAGPMALRRLTRREYQNTLRDLDLGINAADVARDIPADAVALTGFAEAGLTTETEADRFLGAAELVGQTITAARLPSLLGCNTTVNGEAGCVAQFVRSFGRRAYRRPLDDEEQKALIDYYSQVRSVQGLGYDFAGGVRMLVQVMLQSPNFLYHQESGAAAPIRENGLIRLGPYEMASRLSYYLWGSMPDATLFSAADADKLQTVEEIATQAKRMLASPKARDTVQSFYDSYLNVSDRPTLQKEKSMGLTSELASAMAAETRTFIADLFDNGTGKLETLLTAPYTFANKPLALFYGTSSVTSPTAMTRIELSGDQRRGVLMHAGLLASNSLSNATSPTKRGRFILERLICAPPPLPTGKIDMVPPAADPKLTRRKQYEQRYDATLPCGSCHRPMDAIGYAFESFSAAGKWRAIDNKQLVDTATTISGIDGAERTVTGATDLVVQLARSAQVRDCTVRQWFRYALQRPETPEEAGSIAQVLGAFGASDFDLRALVGAIPATKTFRFRSPTVEEMP